MEGLVPRTHRDFPSLIPGPPRPQSPSLAVPSAPPLPHCSAPVFSNPLGLASPSPSRPRTDPQNLKVQGSHWPSAYLSSLCPSHFPAPLVLFSFPTHISDIGAQAFPWAMGTVHFLRAARCFTTSGPSHCSGSLLCASAAMRYGL